MLERAPVPQRWGRKLFWGFAAVELVILGLSYVGCNRLNNDSGLCPLIILWMNLINFTNNYSA